MKKNLYGLMDELAQEIKPGAEGLLFMPYLMGERSPLWDPQASGSFIGLKWKHQKPHFIRAVLEGVGFALAQNYEIFQKELGIDPPYLFAGGGGAKSLLWLQIISDILGKSFLIPEELETETKGAAMLAGLGTGMYREMSEMQRGWLKPAKAIVPREKVHLFYQKIFPLFKSCYIINKELTQQLHSYQSELAIDQVNIEKRV